MNTTSTPLAHHTFSPWAVDGDRRVVAAEREWDEMLKIDEEARLREGRTRVMVDVDVFEDYQHMISTVESGVRHRTKTRRRNHDPHCRRD